MAYDYAGYFKNYNKKNIVYVSLKLNRKTDKDLVEKLEHCENKQKKVKELLRKALKEEGK